MLFGLLSFVVWSNQKKTKNNTIWRHRDCNANILGCVFVVFVGGDSTFFYHGENQKIASITCCFPILACCPWMPLDAKPKRPTI